MNDGMELAGVDGERVIFMKAKMAAFTMIQKSRRTSTGNFDPPGA